MKFTFNYYDGETLTIESNDHARQWARISYDGEKRAETHIGRLFWELENARSLIDTNHAELTALQTAFDTWARSFVKKWMDWIAGHGRLVSWAIVGPAGMGKQERKQRLANNGQESRWAALEKSLAGYKKRIDRIQNPVEKMSLESLRVRLQSQESELSAMKAANVAFRKTKTGAYYQGFELESCRRRIKATQGLISTFESADKMGRVETGCVLTTGVAAVCVQNPEAMRVQFIFDGKPDDATRTALKRAAFKWSPKNGAWQRQLTNNGISAARELVASWDSPVPVAEYTPPKCCPYMTKKMSDKGWGAQPDGMMTRESEVAAEYFLSIENQTHGHDSVVLIAQEEAGIFVRKVFSGFAEAVAFAESCDVAAYSESLRADPSGRLMSVDYQHNARRVKAVLSPVA